MENDTPESDMLETPVDAETVEVVEITDAEMDAEIIKFETELKKIASEIENEDKMAA